MCASDATRPREDGTGRPPVRNLDAACVALLEQFSGDVDLASLSDTLIQRLLALAVGAYAAKLDAGEPCEPFAPENRPTAAQVCPVVARMLKAADVDLFELAIWQHLVD